MGEHPTVLINDEEMELIEFHRAKEALEKQVNKQEKEVDRIKEDPKANFHDQERELDILNGALETFEKVYNNYIEKYGDHDVQVMVE